MHNDDSDGNLLSSKFVTVRLSAGALRFFGTAGFLKGSAPLDFAHGWHRNPGPGFTAIVYFVCRNRC